MRNITKNLIAVTTLLATTGFASNASAVCTFTGKITRAYAYASGASDYGFYYLNPTHSGIPANYVVYFRINSDDDRASDALAAAMASDREITAQGSATACPTTGSYRFGGDLRYVNVYPGR